MKDARGDQVEDESLFSDSNRVSGIVATLIPGNDVELGGDDVDNLTLSFIAPLGAHDRDILVVFHVLVLAASPGRGSPERDVRVSRIRNSSRRALRFLRDLLERVGRSGTGRNDCRRSSSCTRLRIPRGKGTSRGSCSRRHNGCIHPSVGRGVVRCPPCKCSNGSSAGFCLSVARL